MYRHLAHRLAAFSALIATLAGLVGWIAPREIRYPLPEGVVFDVAADGGQTAFDLPLLSANEHYLLVVSNLSSDVAARQIELRCDPIHVPRLLPLQASPVSVPERLPPLEVTGAPPDSQEAQELECGAITLATWQPFRKHRRFWLHTGQEPTELRAGWRPVDAHLAGEGQRVRVFVDVDDCVPPETTQWIIERFEQRVAPLADAWLGPVADVDGDGKFSILLTSWLERLDGGKVALGGMVWPGDFDAEGVAPFSNQADVLYLNAQQRPGRHLETLLMHEFTHAVTASGRRAADSVLFTGADEESWLNEALAHVAENLISDNWSNLDYRVASYLDQPAATPLVVESYTRHGLWRDAPVRGSSYLFLRWCAARYGNGLLSHLIHSPRRGIGNLEAATGERFEELYRRFAVEQFVGRSSQSKAAGDADETKLSWSSYQRAGDYQLAGPRFTRWDLAATPAPPVAEVAGTASAYYVLSSSAAGARRISIQAEEGAVLQVTLVRLPSDAPRLKATATVSPRGDLAVSIQEESGSAVTLTHAMVTQRGEAVNGLAESRVIRGEELSALLGSRRLLGRETRQANISLDGLSPSGSWTLCLVGRDEHDRPIAAWVDVE